MTTIIRVIDTETTGFKVEEGHKAVEVGWCDVYMDGGKWTVGIPDSRLVNPGRPIPPEASAIHHITDEDVRLAPPIEEVMSLVMVADDGFPLTAFCAHNALFDQKFLPGISDTPWICTWRNALILAPQAPNHSNQCLRYWLKLSLVAFHAEPSHRAGPDAYVTAHLLARMLTKITLEQAIANSVPPTVLPKFHFGMHEGKPIAEVPSGYLDWILQPKQKDMDPDVRHTAFVELGRRRAAATYEN